MSVELSNHAVVLGNRDGNGRRSPALRYRTLTVVPSATRLVGSLRDLGYDFLHAIADLVDNSISAGARQVRIELRFEGLDSWVRISDDGRGMSGSRLTEALRFGTRRSYDPSDLGKFGLGLKTASISQAKCLLVASRTDPVRQRISARMLSLEHVQARDAWEILNLNPNERGDKLVEHLRGGSGTVVVWEDLDRVVSYRRPAGERARAAFQSLAERLDVHLGMVFHRFLSGEAAGDRAIKITINGVEVEPWDPFARSETATQTLEPHILEIESRNGRGQVRFQPYVLPPKERFSRSMASIAWPARHGGIVSKASTSIGAIG
jgi:hypothetical protein